MPPAAETPTAPSGARLATTALTVGYDRLDVVHEVSMSIEAGTVTALVGPNGSGKSTLLRAVARLQRIRSGRIELGDGVDALALGRADFARRVTLLAQSRPVPSGISVRDVVAFGRYPHRSRVRGTEPDSTRAIDQALRITNVADLAERSVEHLSGGQLQRVWLAACLAQETGVLLLDEPTTYLDLRFQVETLDLIRDLADAQSIAVGVVLHDLDQAAAVADRVLLLDAGRVVADGTPEQVYDAELLSAVYGIRIEVGADENGIRTRALGAHHARGGRAASVSH